MTNRERLLRTLQCQPTDRPPFPMWLGFAPWGETLERWRKESGIADFDWGKLIDGFGFEPFFQWVPLEYGPCPHFEHKVLQEDAEFVVSLDWRGITMRNRRDGHSMPEWLAHPIKSRADWERYKAERLQPRLDERLRALPEFLKNVTKSDAPVQVGGFPWGIFGTPRDLLGAEEILLGFYDDPEMIRDMISTYTTLWLALYEKVAEKVQIDHIHIWEDMSGKQGSLISMDMVEDFMMPAYDRVADFARRHGVAVVSVDSDGLVDELVPAMMRHGVNAYLPFEVQAGNNVEDFRRRYPALGILGGLDKNALAADRKAIHREIDRAERMLALGGYIVGFDHLIPPNVPWTNFVYAVERLRALCGR